MDINVLTLSLGNSRLAIGVFAAGELEYSTRIGVEQQADWTAVIAEAWSRIATSEGAAVAAATVNPPLSTVLESAIRHATGQDAQWIGKDLDLPMKVRTERPEQTGVDRVLNVAAAFEQLQKACVVVDAGTAITVNVCNDAGEFLGGAIVPGVNLAIEALHRRTAQLPAVTFERPSGPFGHSTSEAIRSGIFHGVRGMVKELVEVYATEFGRWPEVIATGGDAAKLFADSELIHAVSPDLVLYGAALAYTEHHIRHRS